MKNEIVQRFTCLSELSLFLLVGHHVEPSQLLNLGPGLPQDSHLALPPLLVPKGHPVVDPISLLHLHPHYFTQLPPLEVRLALQFLPHKVVKVKQGVLGILEWGQGDIEVEILVLTGRLG